MPKVSIILPIYNVENYLERCVESIIAQTLSDIEIILATDGPEACDRICEEYAKKDTRVKIVSHPGSYGKAFNKSLEIAQGEYIGIVETDDWCDVAMFEKLYTKAIEKNADVVKCGFYFAYDKNHKKRKYLYDEYADCEDFSVFNCSEFLRKHPSVWSAIYKKEFLINNDIKMIEERIPYIDAPFHYETFYKASQYVLVNEPLYYYYQNNLNQTVQNVTVYDILKTEKYAYAKLKQLPDIYKEIKEGFLWATMTHLVWNYESLKDKEDKKKFWLEAHNYVNELDLTNLDYIYLEPWIKEFFLLLKNKRCANYLGRGERRNPYKKYWIKLFGVLPFIFVKQKFYKMKTFLFGFIPFFEYNGLEDKNCIKLFFFITILSWKKVTRKLL